MGECGLSKNTGQTAGRLAGVFDIPGMAVGETRVTVTGTERVYVENHRGIAEYSQEQISVRCGRMLLTVVGSRLRLRAMDRRDLLITGRIICVRYE